MSRQLFISVFLVLGTLDENWIVAQTDIVFYGAIDPPIE